MKCDNGRITLFDWPNFLILVFLILFTASARIWHVKSAGTGTTAEGTTWANALNCDSMIHVLENDVSAGDIFFVKDSGTLTLAENLDCSARDGSATAPITIIGVKGSTTNDSEAIVFSDWSVDSADFSFFDCAAYQFKVGDYYILRNFSFQGSIANTVSTGSVCVVVNCKFNQDNGSSANRQVLQPGTYTTVSKCEFLSANCGGVNSSSFSKLLFCTFHDMPDATYGQGVLIGGPYSVILSCIFDNIKNIAVKNTTNNYVIITNNTFHNCATDVAATSATGYACINNIHDSTKTEAYIWTTQTNINFFWANHCGRCVDYVENVDSTGVFADWSLTTGDPLFTNPATFDFTLQAGSPCLNTGTEAP